MPTFHLITLGCAKNRVDSEILLADLLARGLKPTDQAEGADLIVVNTCAFIQPAVQEAIDHLLSAAELKKKGAVRFVVGLGCLPARFGRSLAREMIEVDLFVASSALSAAGRKIEDLLAGRRLPRLVLARERFLNQADTPRILTTPPGSAYFKVAEGCPNRCSFCTIPAIRGRLRSRTIRDVLAEVTRLSLAGVREANLIAQDLTAYGQDLEPPVALKDLIKALEAAPQGPEWIRLLYLNPARIDEDFLDVVASARRVLPYLDVPLQHVSPRLIKKMSRRLPAQDLLSWVARIRERLPGVVLRTTFLLGFPSETEAEFEGLLDFAAQAELDHVGGFTYWAEEGTPAARLEGQVPLALAQERLARLMALQQRINLEKNKKRRGETIPVLVEGLHPESDLLLVGRAWFQAPEVDGQVIIRRGRGRPGCIQPASIVAAQPYDLIAELKSTKTRNKPRASLTDPKASPRA